MQTNNLSQSAGFRFREAMKKENPLQIVGTINANHALLASHAGFNAIYLSGGGVAAGSLGIPDLGITTLEDVLIDINRITNVVDTPLMVDVDTGFGSSAFNIERTVKSLIKAGAAALHIEDQVGAKRCGHRPGKEIVSNAEMVDRLKAAAVPDISYYQSFVNATGIPVLANITEFGMIPMYTIDELQEAGVGLVLYPLSAFRAANKAAQNVFEHIRKEGTQKNVLHTMQTRQELYESINYYDYEKKMDELFKRK